MSEAISNSAFVYDDGGRKDAGYKGDAGDCVCRAIANCSLEHNYLRRPETFQLLPRGLSSLVTWLWIAEITRGPHPKS